MNSGILIASTHGPALQKILIEANPTYGRIDLWRHHSPLLEQLSAQAYALLVIDLTLLPQVCPDRPFFEAVKVTAPNTLVLLLARYKERRQAIACLPQGAADYLLLPLHPVEASLKIKRCLELHAAQSQPSLNTTADDLLLLHEAGQEINQTLQLDEVLKIILAKAEQATGSDLATIYLADRNETLNTTARVTKSSSQVNGITNHTLMFNLAQQVALSRQSIYERPTVTPARANQTLQTTLVIPLLARDKLMGVLALGSRQAAAFADNQVRWLSVFCDRAAIAIENARLFHDLSSAYIDLAQSREKILQSRNTLQVLFDGISDELYIVDQNLNITALNRVSAAEFQEQADELLGQSYLSLAWAGAAPELLDRINESLQAGHETTWIPPEDTPEPYLKDREFRIYPIHNRLNQVEQVLVFAQDVSERRRLQASLFRSANLVAVGQLAGSIAHQINNPLTVAMANSQLILLEADPHSEIHELTTGIFKATDRIQSIVKNLVDFSNQETYIFVETDLIDTIEGALALVIRPLKKLKIEVIKDYQAQPRLAASVSHLKLVWMNLLLNARDAVAGHTDRPQITLSTHMVSEREVKIVIADNGRGISEQAFEQLFRPFFTTKPVGQGLGLGLYSAHAIIERHNGQIKAASQPGVVTTFEVTLPLDNPRDL